MKKKDLARNDPGYHLDKAPNSGALIQEAIKALPGALENASNYDKGYILGYATGAATASRARAAQATD